MQIEVVDFFKMYGLTPEGREYLSDRSLSIPEAQRRGIFSDNKAMGFAYRRDGKIVRMKYRSMSDKKKQWFSEVPKDEVEDFKMPFFCQFKCPTSDDLFITEGEFDCIALAQIGAVNVCSLPNGAASVETTFKNNYEFLQQFERIFICFDMDAAGEAAATKAMQLLSPRKFRRINFPKKDANDWLKDNPYLEFKDLEFLMGNARKVESKNFVNLLDLPDEYFDAFDLGISTGYTQLDMLIGGIRLGEVTVISADTGAGKSTFCLNFFKNLVEQGKNIWLNSYEMAPHMVMRKFASIVLKKHMKFKEFSEADHRDFKLWLKNNNCYLNILNDKIDADALRKQFEIASLAYGVKYILLDHLDYLYGNGKKKSAMENIDDTVRQIHSLAMEFQVGVVLVVHPKQLLDNKEVTMHDLKGSSSIKQYADNIIILSRMDRFDSSDLLRVKVRMWKNRLTGKEGFFYMRFQPDTDSYTETF